ncbi:MAG: hypothetical protein RLZZ157_212 [Pseudomonadota bacterium]|jgi:glycosyltransferase involved in cell wall biosynthesis
MRIALVADAYAPMASSASVLMQDLAQALVARGHTVTVIVAAPHLHKSHDVEMMGGLEIVRLRTRPTKDVGLLRRLLGEILLPVDMMRHLLGSPLAKRTYDGLVWYSPTIFLGPFIAFLKCWSGSSPRAYLILRDIFPQWAVDLGILKRGLVHACLTWIERFQYGQADVIGVQSTGNLRHFDGWSHPPEARLEVLNNWIAIAQPQPCAIDLSTTALQGRSILVYAGNMGPAQGLDWVMDLAFGMAARTDIGFVFVGRGSMAAHLRARAAQGGMTHIMFFDEIPPEQIPSLYAQCHIGLVSLDPRHTTQNVPGKFLSYMQAGLPVLARLNPGNDLEGLIAQNRVGEVVETTDMHGMQAALNRLLQHIAQDPDTQARCKALAAEVFSVDQACAQIERGLQG